MDELKGNDGSDIFALGETGQVYYDDEDPLTPGLDDYALIADFKVEDGDMIRLSGSSEDYVLDTSPTSNLPGGIAIFLTAGQSDNELIAIVEGSQNLNLNDSTVFEFV